LHELGPHDCFAIPNWAWHEHINRSKSDEAILFSVNDIPIVEAFNLYREEPENSIHTTQAPQVPAKKFKDIKMFKTAQTALYPSPRRGDRGGN
jgi:hypothetical protein